MTGRRRHQVVRVLSVAAPVLALVAFAAPHVAY